MTARDIKNAVSKGQLKDTSDHGSPNFLWQRATYVIVDWYAICTWKITLNGIPNRLNYCVIFILYTSFTNVVAGSIIETGGPWVGEPCTI
jgi:hypothetical protein